MRVANNYVLNEAPNRNDAMGVENNVRLTTMGAKHSHHTEKSTYQRWEITTRKQQRFVRTEINIVLGKNEGYMSSSLGGRSISVGRQLDENFRDLTTSIQWVLKLS